jgi:hypothetical protein
MVFSYIGNRKSRHITHVYAAARRLDDRIRIAVPRRAAPCN